MPKNETDLLKSIIHFLLGKGQHNIMKNNDISKGREPVELSIGSLENQQ
jgi:hypothetical protein